MKALAVIDFLQKRVSKAMGALSDESEHSSPERKQ
jgi:hypothetical protein